LVKRLFQISNICIVKVKFFTESTFDSCFNQTVFCFPTAISSQQLSHTRQLESDFQESTAEPNTPLALLHIISFRRT
jgi:hypothetical protein